MKQRFSSLDVKVIAHELNTTLSSLRLSNIYDLSARTFLLKFHKPNIREQLLIESGFRAHLTAFSRETAPAPSAFVAKLRKTLRSRRVTGVKQVGTDRVLEITFQDGAYRLFLEFYAGGNIVLTDAECTVIALFRNVNEGPENEHLRLGLKYRIEMRQNFAGVPELTRERVSAALEKAAGKQTNEAEEGEVGKQKKRRERKGDALRKALAVSLAEFPPILLDSAFREYGYDTTLLPGQVLEDGALLDRLLEVLRGAGKVVEAITSADTTPGYIVSKPAKKGQPQAPAQDGDAQGKSNVMYDDFHPFKPRQFEDDEQSTLLEFPGFNKTVDEYFSSLEGQKLESRLQEREDNAKRKLEKAREAHEKRVGKLQDAQELNVRKGEAITANVDLVTEAAASINSLVERGMDWDEMGRLIEMEQTRNNAVAASIKLPLKLKENTVTLLLPDANYEDFEDEGFDEEDYEGDETESEDERSNDKPGQSSREKKDQRLAVDIDLGLTAWANASRYYTDKKSAAKKEEKTLQASEKALKSTEAKITADLKKGLKQEKEVLRPVRKQFWFEKFLYFISSDGYLVLGGRDAQQNEIIYRRYLRTGDVYIHADLHGASSIVVKNNPSTPDAPIPPSTLSQAGNLAVATSSAWDSKAVMSAWWVNADQVSKTAPTGEYLTTGGFMIRGRKNFLPPAQLVLGFAALFVVSEESKAKHVRHRIRDDVLENALKQDHDENAGKGTQKQEDAEDSDSDEDFPDAKLESEDDEDFPDAKLESENEEQSDPDPAPNEDETKPEDEPNEPQETEASGDQDGKSGRRHLSTHERRLLRKGKAPDKDDGEPSNLSAASDSESESETEQDATESVSTSNPQAQLNRGQRRKARKLKSKYAAQDDEDRELALRLVGAAPKSSTAAEKVEAARQKAEEAERNKQRRREQHERARKAEEARMRKVTGGAEAGDEEADLTGLEDEESVRLSLLGLDAFVGNPLPGDEVMAAVPVCAPWSALGKCRYRVKLQPGAVKKGKLVREILTRWEAEFKAEEQKSAKKGKRKVEPEAEAEVQGEAKDDEEPEADSEKTIRRERECIRAWKDAEVFGVVPVGKARVVVGAGGNEKGGKGAKGAKGGSAGKKGGAKARGKKSK